MKKPFKLLTFSVAVTALLANAPLSGAERAWAAALPVTKAEASAASSEELAGGVAFTSKEIKSESPELMVDMEIPVISGMKDVHYQDELNDIIERHAMKSLEEAEAEAKEAAEMAKADGFTIHPYELIVKADVKMTSGAANGNRISFTVTTYLATGGTGMPIVDAYNIADLEEAGRVQLQDLFGADYKAIIDEEIYKQIAADSDNYFSGEEGFAGIRESQAFYMEGDEVVILFPKYSIAPGFMGTPEFRIAAPNSAGSAETAEPEQQETAAVLTADQLHATADGVTLVPLRLAAERLGYSVDWVNETRSAELSKGGQWTAVYEGKDAYSLNKTADRKLGAAPVIIKGSMYVPAEFFSDILSASVTAKNGGIVIEQGA